MAGVAGSEQTSGPTAKKHQDEETQGLEKVTDYVEEQENSAELGQVSWYASERAGDELKLVFCGSSY